MLKFYKLLLILTLCVLTSCSATKDSLDYENNPMLEIDDAVFARIGAAPDDFDSANNHFRIRKSLETINFDDLSATIKSCELEDIYFCIDGFLPIILPDRTGLFYFNRNGQQIEVFLSSPDGPLDESDSDRPLCDVTMSRLTVKRDDKDYEYIISRDNGVIKFSLPTTQEPEEWYLIAGKLIDLDEFCKK